VLGTRDLNTFRRRIETDASSTQVTEYKLKRFMKRYSKFVIVRPKQAFH